MPVITSLAADDSGLPDRPWFARTDMRHLFLRAVAAGRDGGSTPFMCMEDVNETEFAKATTIWFGDELNA